jgi:hypothetical protein
MKKKNTQAVVYTMIDHLYHNNTQGKVGSKKEILSHFKPFSNKIKS